LLHIKALGVPFVGLLLLSLLVVVFAPIDNFGYRRIGCWRYFDQVQLLFCS
jgi:hypothetical protein